MKAHRYEKDKGDQGESIVSLDETIDQGVCFPLVQDKRYWWRQPTTKLSLEVIYKVDRWY